MNIRAIDRDLPDLPDPSPPFSGGPTAFILHYLRSQRRNIAGLAVGVIGASSCAVGIQYAIKLLVDAMTGPRDWSAASAPLFLILGLVAAEAVLWRFTGWLCCRTTLDIGVRIRVDLFRLLTGQPMRYFAKRLAGSLGQRITGTAGHFGALTNAFVWRILPPIVDLCGAVIIFATIDGRMTLALAVCIVLVTAALVAFGRRGQAIHRAYAEQHSAAGGDLVDTITNIWAIKAFSARSREIERLRRNFTQEASAQRASWMYTEFARVLHDIALLAITGGMLVWCISLWSRGSITPGDVVVVTTLTFRILQGSRDMALALVDTVQNVGFIDETLRVLGEPQALADLPSARPMKASSGAIAFRNVSFSYRPDRAALHGLSFEIPAGQKVGIVGPSGAGKSTCIGLLQRLHDPDSGEILIDGQPIMRATQDSVRALLAVVPQEIMLLHRTVLENIRFANPQATAKDVIAAATAARAHGFISNLPDGYDTVVGERGGRLSGGQRQRIGIARAFLRDTPIIILDEATSALDTQSEAEIQRALIESDRTVLAIAHRLSTISAFDRVIVLDGGRVVEDGPVPDLLERRGLFYRMWREQVVHPLHREATGEAA